MFELAFGGTNTALTAEQQTLMTIDAARCTVKNNSMQPAFWSQVTEDGYYHPVEDVSTYAADLTANQDWTYWRLDDEGESPFCTYDKTFFDPPVEQWLSIY